MVLIMVIYGYNKRQFEKETSWMTLKNPNKLTPYEIELIKELREVSSKPQQNKPSAPPPPPKPKTKIK